MGDEKLRRQIADKEQELAALRGRRNAYLEEVVMPVEVTVVMPVYNAWLTLSRALCALSKGVQSVPMSIVLRDNGSMDPGADALAGVHVVPFLRKACGFADVLVMPPTPQSRYEDSPEGTALSLGETKCRNISFMHKTMIQRVETEFALFVDADVITPVGGVRDLLEAMKANERLATLGILYDPRVDHVQMGCTMVRTAIHQPIDIEPPGCRCRFLTRKVRSLGYEAQHLDPRRTTARHLRDEFP